MADNKQKKISIDMSVAEPQYLIIDPTFNSVLFEATDKSEYVYSIHGKKMADQSETTVNGVKELNLEKKCDLSIKSRTNIIHQFNITEDYCECDYRGYILRVDFLKPEGSIPCAQHILIVQPVTIKVSQVLFLDSNGKANPPRTVLYEAGLRFSLQVKYNRDLLREEEEPKPIVKAYRTDPSDKSSYIEVSDIKFKNSEENTDIFHCNVGLQESHAGASYAFSLGCADLYEPPFKTKKQELAPSVQIINLVGRKLKHPQITSVVWSSKEMIKFNVASPKREEICYNEDGFLHIHTRGMYGQRVRIDLYEKRLMMDYLKIGTIDNILILDNTAYVPIEMAGVYTRAQRGRWWNGLFYSIIAKVTPKDASIAAFEGDAVHLQIYGKAEDNKATKATIDGTQKFVINEVEYNNEDKSKIEKCHLCNKDITLDEIKKICINKKGKCLIINDILITKALPYLNQYRKKVGINTCARKAHFIAQICAETKFYELQEKFTYSDPERLRLIFHSYFKQFGDLKKQQKEAERLSKLSLDKKNWIEVASAIYGENHPLGKKHTMKNDGWRYSGKGFKQITWKDNYQHIQDYFNRYMKIDNEPNVMWTDNDNSYSLKTNPKDAITSALAYWGWKRINLVANGTDDKSVVNVTKLINSKLEGIEERKRYFKNATEILQVKECIKCNNTQKDSKGTIILIAGKSYKYGTEKAFSGNKEWTIYKLSVFQNMTYNIYASLKDNNNLPHPNYTYHIARDAHMPHKDRSEKRYGSSNECPPGKYYLNKGVSTQKFHLYLSDTKGTGSASINKPDGNRIGIAIHGGWPIGAIGCLTTHTSNYGNKIKGQPINHEVALLIKNIPDINDSSKDVIVILENREAQKTNKIWTGIIE